MTDPRLYDQDDVRTIFTRATRARGPEPSTDSSATGLTLTDLQEIGREVGVDPRAIARAAADLDARTAVAPVRRTWGMPTEVTRAIPLPGPLTDPQWERLVAVLRSTFRARGRVSSEGGLREWANGNLHAFVEPTRSGYQLRLSTRKGNAGMVNVWGVTALIVGVIAFGSALLSGGLQGDLFAPWMMCAVGVAALLSNVIRLPRWAQERQQQMEKIATQIDAIIAEPPPPGQEPEP